MSTTYLSHFFSEKKINYQLFEIIDENGFTHFIDSDYVIEAIFNTGQKERLVITQTLRKLDFYNQPIEDYLKFLAESLVVQFNKVL